MTLHTSLCKASLRPKFTNTAAEEGKNVMFHLPRLTAAYFHLIRKELYAY